MQFDFVKRNPYHTFASGELAEWSIASVLKTVDFTVRGFESLTLRANSENKNVIICNSDSYVFDFSLYLYL